MSQTKGGERFQVPGTFIKDSFDEHAKSISNQFRKWSPANAANPLGKRLKKDMANHQFQWENSLSMAIFNSYVKLPEGQILKMFVDLYALQTELESCGAEPVKTRALK